MIAPATAIWLYGSRARGDFDQFSDTDLLVVSPAIGPEALDVNLGQASKASKYTWAEIQEMASYGSLFLWHLREEGEPVFESADVRGRLSALLISLNPYRYVHRDLRAFRTVLGDVRQSMDDGHAVLEFELATLGTMFRHAAILGCFVSGDPRFSRHGAVAELVARWDLPPEWSLEFPTIYEFRMASEGRIASASAEPSPDLVRLWLGRVSELLQAIEERAG